MHEPGGKQYTTAPPDAGRRLDVVIARAMGISRTRAAALIRAGSVSSPVSAGLKPSTLVAGGEVFRLPEVEEIPRTDSLLAEDIPLAVVFEDDQLLVVDKPAGMVVHPAAGHWRGTLANAVAARISAGDSRLDLVRPGIVHRLDKDTSGLIVVAKTLSAHENLTAQIKSRSATRSYLALTLGHWPQAVGAIEAPLGRLPFNRKKMAVVAGGGRRAITRFRVLESFSAAELVEAGLETGRTHQIRVHFSHAGHPVLGDPLYGGAKTALRGIFPEHRECIRRAIEACSRQALHAWRLSFEHPYSGERLDFSSAPPQDFERALALLRTEAEN